MPGFASYDDMISEMTVNGKQLTWDFFKVGATGQGAGNWQSLWNQTGSPGAAGNANNTPGMSFASSTGSINFNAVSPDLKSLVTFGGSSTTDCSLHLYDRLVGVGNISITTTGPKTVNSTALTRYLSSSYVEAWAEVTTATATSVASLSMSYTAADGTQGRVGGSVSMPAAATVATTMLKLPLHAGDKGVLGITALQVAPAATGAGIVAVYLQRPLATIPLRANVWNERDMVLQLAALPQVQDNASLGLQYLASATTATNFWGTVRLAYG